MAWIAGHVLWVLSITFTISFFLWLNSSRSGHNSLKLVLALTMLPGMLQVLNGYLWEERIKESGRQQGDGVSLLGHRHKASVFLI